VSISTSTSREFGPGNQVEYFGRFGQKILDGVLIEKGKGLSKCDLIGAFGWSRRFIPRVYSLGNQWILASMIQNNIPLGFSYLLQSLRERAKIKRERGWMSSLEKGNSSSEITIGPQYSAKTGRFLFYFIWSICILNSFERALTRLFPQWISYNTLESYRFMIPEFSRDFYSEYILTHQQFQLIHLLRVSNTFLRISWKSEGQVSWYGIMQRLTTEITPIRKRLEKWQ